VDFDVPGQLLIIYCAFIKQWRENKFTNGFTVKQCISYLYTSRKLMI